MRIRQPAVEPPAYEVHPATAKEFGVEIVTPMIGGGVNALQPDQEMPVRTSAIRGQLRYWWRLLNRKHYPGSPELFAKERSIWGGMAQGDEDHASKVRIRVEVTERAQLESVPVSNKGIVSVNSYALFPLRDKNSQWLRAGYKFKLVVKCDDDIWQEVEPALRWWASFGGLGTRTRRGMGKIRIRGLRPVTEDEAKSVGCELVVKQQAEADSAWNSAKAAVESLYRFRQGVDIGRNPGSAHNRPGRSRWPEPDSIRQITGKHARKHPVIHPLVKEKGKKPFPRACFGMPIIYEIRGEGEPPTQSLQPSDYERMASPLILFPYPDGDNYRPAALLLPTDHLENLDLELMSDGRTVALPAGQWWPQNDTEACDWASQIRPMQERGCDPLQAFLKFFGAA